MKTLTILFAIATLALPAYSDTRFSVIGEDAGKIQLDATELSKDLKAKVLDESKVKADIAALGQDIIKLRKDVETIDASLNSLTAEQKKDWELIKTKVQLLNIFYDRKTDLLQGDLKKNRSMLRAHADGIAKRAALLRETAMKMKS